VDFLLRRDRGIATAQAFFRKALALNPPLFLGKFGSDITRTVSDT
jgi:hypothetical protein